MDGARTQKTMPAGAINPRKMNISDGGKNRAAMRGVGTAGLRTVLIREKKWPPGGLSLVAARSLLCKWHVVRDQLTEAEELCRANNILLAYIPKAHPWLNPIEHYWRLVKSELQDVLDIDDIRQHYLEIALRFTQAAERERTKCSNWCALAHQYWQYYARGEEKFIRESDFKRFDLDSLPSPSVAPLRLHVMEDKAKLIHDINLILIQGKKYPLGEEPW